MVPRRTRYRCRLVNLQRDAKIRKKTRLQEASKGGWPDYLASSNPLQLDARAKGVAFPERNCSYIHHTLTEDIALVHRRRMQVAATLLALLVCSVPGFAADVEADSRLVLQAVAMRQSCREVYPALTEKIDRNMFAEAGGFSREVRDRIREMEESQDPTVRAQVTGAAAMFRDPALLEAGCHSLAGE